METARHHQYIVKKLLLGDPPVAVGLAVRNGFLASRLPVRLNVEVDEQEEVTREQSAAEKGSALGAGAGAHVRQVRPVRGDEVRVC